MLAEIAKGEEGDWHARRDRYPPAEPSDTGTPGRDPEPAPSHPQRAPRRRIL